MVVKEKNKFLFYQKNHLEWLSGQWELPTFVLETNDDKLKQYPKIKVKKGYAEAPSIKTGITKYSIYNYIVEMSLLDFGKLTEKIEIEYVFKTHNEKLNLSTASSKVLKKVL